MVLNNEDFSCKEFVGHVNGRESGTDMIGHTEVFVYVQLRLLKVDLKENTLHLSNNNCWKPTTGFISKSIVF